MRVGFIGLGVMGRPMAEHILRASHELCVWARRPQGAEPLLAAGAQWCISPAELASRSQVVFTMVTASADVESVVLGDAGLIAGAQPGTVVVDCSTIAPTVARRLAERLAARGVEFLDAPVSGGAAGAREARLAVMVGGRAPALDQVRPLLEILGTTIVHVGASGAGQVAKACNQLVMVAAIQACAEAARLAQAAGLDFSRVHQAMTFGSANSRVLDFFGGKMAIGDFAAGVEARLHHKDFGMVMDEAARLAASLPVAASVWQQLNALMAQGWGADDSASLLRVLERATA